MVGPGVSHGNMGVGLWEFSKFSKVDKFQVEQNKLPNAQCT